MEKVDYVRYARITMWLQVTAVVALLSVVGTIGYVWRQESKAEAAKTLAETQRISEQAQYNQDLIEALRILTQKIFDEQELGAEEHAYIIDMLERHTQVKKKFVPKPRPRPRPSARPTPSVSPRPSQRPPAVPPAPKPSPSPSPTCRIVAGSICL